MAVWKIAATIVADLKVFFEPGSEEEGRFKKWVDSIAEEQFERLGVTGEGDDEERQLRAIILSLVVYGENPEKVAQVSELTEVNLMKMDADTRASALIASVKGMDGDKKWRNFLEELKKATDPELVNDLIAAVGSAREEKQVERAVKLLSEPKIVRPQDHVFLYMNLRRNAKAKKAAFTWLRENWDYVRGLAGDKSLEFYPRATATTVRDAGEAEEFEKFFGGMAGDLVVARAIDVGRGEIKARLALIKRDGEDVQKRVR